MYVVHGDEFLEGECGGGSLAVIDVEALPVAAPIAVCVGSISLADLHPPLRTPAVVAEEVSEPVRGRKRRRMSGRVRERVLFLCVCVCVALFFKV